MSSEISGRTWLWPGESDGSKNDPSRIGCDFIKSSSLGLVPATGRGDDPVKLVFVFVGRVSFLSEGASDVCRSEESIVYEF